MTTGSQPVSFKAIASIPSFELWLLLRYEDIHAPIHHDKVMARLKQHIPGYGKGVGGGRLPPPESGWKRRYCDQRYWQKGSRTTLPLNHSQPCTDLSGVLTTLRD